MKVPPISVSNAEEGGSPRTGGGRRGEPGRGAAPPEGGGGGEGVGKRRPATCPQASRHQGEEAKEGEEDGKGVDVEVAAEKETEEVERMEKVAGEADVEAKAGGPDVGTEERRASPTQKRSRRGRRKKGSSRRSGGRGGRGAEEKGVEEKAEEAVVGVEEVDRRSRGSENVRNSRGGGRRRRKSRRAQGEEAGKVPPISEGNAEEGG